MGGGVRHQGGQYFLTWKLLTLGSQVPAFVCVSVCVCGAIFNAMDWCRDEGPTRR